MVSSRPCKAIVDSLTCLVVGHFTLLNILLPLIEQTAEKYGEARIVTTSSSVHMVCQELDLDLTMSPTPIKSPPNIDSGWRYGRSKLGVLLMTKELARRLEKKGVTKVYANSIFPGNIPTEAMDTWKSLFGLVGAAFKGVWHVLGQSLEDAAASAIYAATSPEVVTRNQKGAYLIPIATEDEPSKLAQDPDLARNLWYWCDDKVTKALGKGWQGDE
jgi:NAD(P)-dependent dehydrogenase (short-subunit alcohol dehydrogenase family)